MSMFDNNLGTPGNQIVGPSGGDNKTPHLFFPPTNVTRTFEYDLYSSGRFAAGATVSGQLMMLFNYTQGSTGPGYAAVSSVSETNVEVGGMMPGGQTFNVSSIAFEIYGDAGTAPLIGDVRTIMRLSLIHI